MTIYKCDICKKELKRDDLRVILFENSTVEICKNCRYELEKYIKELIKINEQIT